MADPDNSKWSELGKALSEAAEQAAKAFTEFFEAFNKKENN